MESTSAVSRGPALMGRPPRRQWRPWALLIVALALLPPAGAAGQSRGPDVVAGQVVGMGEPLKAAEVVIISSAGTIRTTVSDSFGHFRVMFPSSSHPYSVRVSALGFHPDSARLARAPGADGAWFVRVTLEASPIGLAGLDVEARRPTPTRSTIVPGSAPEGADERPAEGVVAGVAPEADGDVQSAAGNVPGVIATSAGLSILGLSADQTAVTLGGLAFSGGRLPAGLLLLTSVATAPYDPSRGGFSGGEVAVNVVPGGPFVSWATDVALVPGPLELSDISGGGRPTAARVALSGRGPLNVPGPYFYSGAIEARHTSTAPASLLDVDVPHVLGVPLDSAARFESLVRQLGIPAGRAGGRSTDELNLLAGIQFIPDESVVRGKQAGLTGYLDLTRERGSGVLPSALATTATDRSAGTGLLMGYFSTFLHAAMIETRAALTRQWSRVRPALDLPAGVLQLAPTGESDQAPTAFAFGGADGGATASDGSLAQATSRVTWYSFSGRHRFQLYGEARYETLSESASGRARGTFVYASLDDLARNQPSAYMRRVVSPQERAVQIDGALSLADSWKATDDLTVLFGARAEANRFLSAPAGNGPVRSAFGLDTHQFPDKWHVSPRFGFTWLSPAAKKSPSYFVVGPTVTYNRGPSGILRGGIGEFRNRLPLGLAVEAMRGTGLPAAGQPLECIGPAVPEAEWPTYVHGGAVAPDACAGGAPPIWTDATPQVLGFARGFVPPHSIRGSLGWEGQLRTLLYSVDAVYSRNLGQRSAVDLNLSAEPAFRLVEEAARPVFAPPAAILPATGAVAYEAARRLPGTGHVMEQRSDASSSTERLTVTLQPEWRQSRYFLRGSYVLSRVREEARGFDAGTAGDPRDMERAPGVFDARHRIQLDVGATYGRVDRSTRYTVSTFIMLQSGRPFTPMVRGDVNGDGFSDDRAFVFDPTRVGDGALATQLDRLLSSAPVRIRQCLRRQLGHVADRNSCRGPWTATANLRLDVRPVSGPLARAVFSLTLSNIPAALDRMLHPDRRAGWDAAAQVDNALYTVRGFDSRSQSFVYAANPHFGEVLAGSVPPLGGFRVSLATHVKLGASVPRQQIDRWGPKRKGEPLSVDSLRDIYTRRIPDPYLPLLLRAESLQLDSLQVARLRTARIAFLNTVYNLADPLARFLASSPRDTPQDSLLSRQTDFTNSAYALLWRQGGVVRDVLSAFQYHLAPLWLTTLFDRPSPPKEGDLVMSE